MDEFFKRELPLRLPLSVLSKVDFGFCRSTNGAWDSFTFDKIKRVDIDFFARGEIACNHEMPATIFDELMTKLHGLFRATGFDGMVDTFILCEFSYFA